MQRSYNLDEAANIAGVCKSKIYESVKSGELKARKFGRRTLILAKDLEEFLGNLPTYNDGKEV